jgi:hypothetical protein
MLQEESGMIPKTQNYKNTGYILWDSDQEGVKATYLPAPNKSAHGFFHMATIKGNGFDPSIQSVLKFNVALVSDPPEGLDRMVPLILFLSPKGSNVRDGQRLKFFADFDLHKISFSIPNEIFQNEIDIHLRVPAQLHSEMRISQFRLLTSVNGNPVSRVPSLSASDFNDRPFSLEAFWNQAGRRLSLTCLDESVFFDLPESWSVDMVTHNQRELVEDFMFGGLRAKFFGVQRLLDKAMSPARMNTGAHGKTVLSYSTGEDSTAALAVLPENTPRYFCRRPYKKFITCTGKMVPLKRRYAEEHAISLVPDCIIVDTDMELLTTKFGGKFGNPTTASVASVGVLLANFLDVSSVSIGAQLETSYLINGRAFTDVFSIKSSMPWKYKRLFNYAGLDICYPVSALSEVLTNRTVTAVADRFFTASCPHMGADLKPCGKCYKCFRKVQLSGGNLSKLPPKTLKLLDKNPLKMATSSIYAARKGGFKHHAFDRYKDLDLSFLERYYDRAVETLVPFALRDFIRQRYCELGFEPMTADDEYKLRTIATHIAPKLYCQEEAFPPVCVNENETPC